MRTSPIEVARPQLASRRRRASGGPYNPQPTKQDVETACLALPGGVNGDTCNFNNTFSPGYLSDRIPVRPDWPAAAAVPAP